MIKSIAKKDSSHISRIHVNALSSDFLPSLGFDFLKTFYNGVIGKAGVFGFVSKDKEEINGFVVGTENMDRFFKLALTSKFIALCFYLGIQLLKKPSIVKNILETFTYSSKESGPLAELVVIAVDKSTRGKGVGKKLVLALEQEFRKRKIKEYKLTVTKRNKNANTFYEHLGFKVLTRFNLYSKSWNLLVKRI